MLPAKLCFVDIETTGGSLSFDRIIEIGIVRVEDGRIVETFRSLIDPSSPVSEQILQLTGISQDELDQSPTFYELKKDLWGLLDGALFVAHNARFDFCFLKQEFRRFDLNFSPKQLCTVKLSRQLFPQHRQHNLDSLIKRFGLLCPMRHRALDDASVLWQFYQLVLKQFDEKVVVDTLNKIMKRPSVPIKIADEVLSTLPDTPGVYIFYGQNNLPLYVGKSINIRQRVLNHFSGDHLSSKELAIAQQVESIETISTAGELGALLKESELVKNLQPLYNRLLRKSTKLTLMSSVKNSRGYEEALFRDSETIEPEDTVGILAIFKGRRQAKTALINIAKEYVLCEKLLGVESGKGACFGYRLGKCRGACIGKEHPLKYNLRFSEAFYNLKISSWPFNGPIQIKEANPAAGLSQIFIFDRWCYLGKIIVDDFGNKTETAREVQFDLDIFKILRRFIASPKNRKQVGTFNLSGVSDVKSLNFA